MTCCIHKVRYENGFESLRIVRVTDSYDRLRKSLSTKRRLTTGSQRDIDFIFTYLCSIRNYIRIHIYTILIFFSEVIRPHLWRKKYRLVYRTPTSFDFKSYFRFIFEIRPRKIFKSIFLRNTWAVCNSNSDVVQWYYLGWNPRKLLIEHVVRESNKCNVKPRIFMTILRLSKFYSPQLLGVFQ